jgi:hypothetical protein
MQASIRRDTIGSVTAKMDVDGIIGYSVAG